MQQVPISSVWKKKKKRAHVCRARLTPNRPHTDRHIMPYIRAVSYIYTHTHTMPYLGCSCAFWGEPNFHQGGQTQPWDPTQPRRPVLFSVNSCFSCLIYYSLIYYGIYVYIIENGLRHIHPRTWNRLDFFFYLFSPSLFTSLKNKFIHDIDQYSVIVICCYSYIYNY